MIKSFRDKDARQVLNGKMPKGFPVDIFRAAVKKLELLEAATNLEDLRNPPGNHLEVLGGGREGQHSIRINKQWRICFEWRDGGAWNVEMVDYH